MSSFFRPFKISAIPTEPELPTTDAAAEPVQTTQAITEVDSTLVESTMEEPAVEASPDEDDEVLPPLTFGERHYYKVLLIGLLKLLLHGILIYFFYDKLQTYRVFAEAQSLYRTLSGKLGGMDFRSFLYAGAGVSALLYLLILSQIKVRNRLGYLAFALLFLPDGLLLFQPTITLFTVLFCGLLLMLLRLRTNARYVLCALLVVCYALIMNPFAILLIPVYIAIRAWQKDANWGVRLSVIFLLIFCLLYQFGVLPNLIDLRSETKGTMNFYRLFPPENYPGHVAYYLIDYLAVLGRLLFPFQLFTMKTIPAFLYGVLGLSLTAFLGYNVYYLLTLDWKKPVSANDRLLADITIIFITLYATHAFLEPDYLSAYRHMYAYYPLYLYLFFGAGRLVPRPEVTRSFAGTRPVIFFHKGNDRYVYDVLRHAERTCGHKNVILLGDESNRAYSSNWFSFDEYCTEEATAFASVYNHISEEPYDFELTCFQRHFALYAFMEAQKINECFLCDSDVLLYDNLSEMELGDIDFGCSNANYAVCLGECASPHCTYWTLPRLRQFLDFVMHVYRSNTAWLAEVSKRQKESSEEAAGNVTDMLLLTAWRKIVDDYDPKFRYRNFDRIEDSKVFDHGLSSADNLVTAEYRYRSVLKIKQVRFRKKQPFLTLAQTKEPVKASILHCQNCKEYIPLLSKCSNVLPLYWLTRVLR